MSIEILLIIIAGLIPVGLSINALIKAKKSETELKKSQKELTEKQDKIISLHESVNKKSDEIIRLQQLLTANSETQIKELNKLKTPVPANISFLIGSTLAISSKEFDEIDRGFNEAGSQTGNFLPINFTSTNEGIKKIDAFKNISIRIIINIECDSKQMSIQYDSPGQLQLTGYNAPLNKSGFTLALQKDKRQILFDVSFIETSNISFNYLSPSLLDFKKSKVKISYEFSYPKPYQVGNFTQNMFIMNNEINKLNINQVMLYMKNLTIKVTGLKKIDPFHYEGNISF